MNNIDPNADYAAVLGRLAFQWYVRHYMDKGMNRLNAYFMADFRMSRVLDKLFP